MHAIKGAQKPTFYTDLPFKKTVAREFFELFANYGFTFTDAQKFVLTRYLARKDDGTPQFISCALCKPRQNGKTYEAVFLMLWCALVESKSVFYTAQNTPVASETFKKTIDIVLGEGVLVDFNAYVKHVCRQRGNNEIEFTNGASIKFKTRTKNAARGDSVAVIIVDEAQELTDAQQEALLPVASAAKEPPQIIYTGTPWYPECTGTVFKSFHHKVHDGKNIGTYWIEWGAKTPLPEGLSDEDALKAIAECNPMLGYTLHAEAVLNEYRTMDAEGFARERLGWWSADDGGYEHVVTSELWNACKTDNPPQEDGKQAFGVKFSADGTYAALSVALKVKNRKTYVELVKVASVEHGTGWLVRALANHVGDTCMYLADGQGRSDVLAQRLREQGAPKAYCGISTTKTIISACSAFYDLVASEEIEHFAQPELTLSVTESAKRYIGKNGGFSFGDSPRATSIAAESAALAIYALMNTKRDPNKQQKVVSF